MGGGFGGADFGDFAFGFGADAFVAEVDKVCAADDFDGGEQPCGGCDKGGHAEHGIGDVPRLLISPMRLPCPRACWEIKTKSGPGDMAPRMWMPVIRMKPCQKVMGDSFALGLERAA